MINIEKLNFGAQTVTQFKEVITKNLPFVSWGVDNLFVEELYFLLNASPIHYSSIMARVNNSVGSGYVNDYKINSKEYINDVAKKMYFELLVTGNLFLEVVWRKDRSEGLAGFHVIPSKYMRVGKPDELGAPATKYFYCRDWATYRRGTPIIEFSDFDPVNYTNRQIIHIKQYNGSSEYYGTPSYLAVLNDVKLNHEITAFNLSNIINGCSPGLWVHLNSPAPDSENEQTQILRKIEDRYMGSENAGRVIVSYGEMGDGKPEITQIQTNVEDGYFSSIFELVQHQILCGNGIPDPSIIGLPSRTGFSSSAEQLETAFKLFLSTNIYPTQKFLNRELKEIMQLIYPNQEIDLTITQNNII
jgi:phage portal protein BeeE